MNNSKATIREVYSLVKDVYDKIDNIEIKRDEQLETICQRVNSLEMWRVNIMAKISLGIGIISLAFTCLWQFALKKFVKN